VLPGAGVALLACRPALRRALEQSDAPDERAAYRVLLDAISAPIHTIASNAGYDARAVMTDLAQAGCGYGFDALSGQIVDAAHAGILDVAATQQMIPLAYSLVVKVLATPGFLASPLGGVSRHQLDKCRCAGRFRWRIYQPLRRTQQIKRSCRQHLLQPGLRFPDVAAAPNATPAHSSR
jgi:hypothetical protein